MVPTTVWPATPFMLKSPPWVSPAGSTTSRSRLKGPPEATSVGRIRTINRMLLIMSGLLRCFGRSAAPISRADALVEGKARAGDHSPAGQGVDRTGAAQVGEKQSKTLVEIHQRGTAGIDDAMADQTLKAQRAGRGSNHAVAGDIDGRVTEFKRAVFHPDPCTAGSAGGHLYISGQDAAARQVEPVGRTCAVDIEDRAVQFEPTAAAISLDAVGRPCGPQLEAATRIAVAAVEYEDTLSGRREVVVGVQAELAVRRAGCSVDDENPGAGGTETVPKYKAFVQLQVRARCNPQRKRRTRAGGGDDDVMGSHRVTAGLERDGQVLAAAGTDGHVTQFREIAADVDGLECARTLDRANHCEVCHEAVAGAEVAVNDDVGAVGGGPRQRHPLLLCPDDGDAGSEK